MGIYWEKRFLQDKALSVNATEKYLAKEQKRYFTEAVGEITKQIEDMYQSFTDQEHITLAEAKRRIARADFKKVDFEKLAEYQIDKNREFKKKRASLPGDVIAAIEKQHARFESGMKTLTRKGQITYLSLLQQNINKALLDLYDKNQMSMYDFLADGYESAYYRSVFNVQKGLGFGKDFVALNRRAIEKAVLTTYKKSNYSKRLYAHCEEFTKNLKDNLIIGLIKGENIDRMAARISRRMDVAASSARRLVRTETAYIYEKATAAAYQECGIEKYEFLATLDYRTSPVCQELDGKVFLVKDAMPGKNYPPMHPNCRSTTVCHFDNDKVTERIAKDEKGKTYEVPSDMTYPEWKKAYGGERKESTDIKKAPDKIMAGLAKVNEIRTDKDLLHFSERLIDNLGIDRSNIKIQVKGMLANGCCKIEKLYPDILTTCRYDTYNLRAADGRSMEYRIKTAFHESFHLSLNGREWDAVNKQYEMNSFWSEMEETFAESASHYMLERYGVTKKLAPAYPDKIVRNLPRLKQLDLFSGCSTIQDFGKVVFETRQNGGNGNWKQMYRSMRKIKLDSRYDIQYFDYIRKHEDELFYMACENVTGMEDCKENIMKELHEQMLFVENTGMSPDSRSIYYWFMSCAMQLEGVK